VIVAVAVNVAKQPLLHLEERVALIRQAVDRCQRGGAVRSTGWLADFARAAGATVIVRGLRAVSDFEYEFQMALRIATWRRASNVFLVRRSISPT